MSNRERPSHPPPPPPPPGAIVLTIGGTLPRKEAVTPPENNMISPSSSSSTSGCHSLSPNRMEKAISMGECREYYSQRLRCVQQFKQGFPTPEHHSEEDTVVDRKLSQLKIDMLSLMEKDVTLMQQLLALNDTMEELKGMQQEVFEDEDEENSSFSEGSEELEIDEQCGGKQCLTTQLLVNDSPSPKRRERYFSRRNSVLRIPIPPCHRRTRGRTFPSFDEEEYSCIEEPRVNNNHERSGSEDHKNGSKIEPPSGYGSEENKLHSYEDFKNHNFLLPQDFAYRNHEHLFEDSSGVSSSNSSDSSGSVRSSIGSRPSSILFRKRSPLTDFGTKVDNAAELEDQLSPLETIAKSHDKRHESQASYDSGINVTTPNENCAKDHDIII